MWFFRRIIWGMTAPPLVCFTIKLNRVILSQRSAVKYPNSWSIQFNIICELWDRHVRKNGWPLSFCYIFRRQRNDNRLLQAMPEWNQFIAKKVGIGGYNIIVCGLLGCISADRDNFEAKNAHNVGVFQNWDKVFTDKGEWRSYLGILSCWVICINFRTFLLWLLVAVLNDKLKYHISDAVNW